MYHILIPSSDGRGMLIEAALITDAAEDVLQKVMDDTRAAGQNRCMEIESNLHALGHFAVIAKWEGRFLL